MTFAPTFRRTFSPTFDRRNTVANGLLNALIAYWPGNEASGNALDLHTNGLTLTDTNTVTNAAGKVYTTARQYTRANGEHHTRPGDDALLSTGDVDITVASWFYMDSKDAENWIASKWEGTALKREYVLQYVGGATDRIRFVVRNMSDTGYGIATANSFGSPSISNWYLVCGWHDAANNQVCVQVNNGVVDTTSYSSGILDTVSPFKIGNITAASSPSGNEFNGRIGPTMFWKSAAGAGGVLTAAQRTALYNAGAGLAYSAFTT